MNTFFLIRNEKEYRIANNIIEKRNQGGVIMLSISDIRPYLTNQCAYLKNVSQWEDFDIIDLSLSRFWLKNYKQIEGIVQKKAEGFYQNEMARSPYFILGLVWHAGDTYYKYIDALNIFFKKHRPQIVYFNPKDNFFSKLVISFMKAYGTKHGFLTL